jgi:hypothetical protein
MDHQPLFIVKGKKKSLTRGRKIFFIFFCLLLSAYFLVISCGKKGPPTLKTSPPPSPSESVDSNNVETTQEKNTKK